MDHPTVARQSDIFDPANFGPGMWLFWAMLFSGLDNLEDSLPTLSMRERLKSMLHAAVGEDGSREARARAINSWFLQDAQSEWRSVRIKHLDQWRNTKVGFARAHLGIHADNISDLALYTAIGEWLVPEMESSSV